MDHNTRVRELNDNFRKILEECPEVVYIGGSILRESTKEVTLAEGIEIGTNLKNVLEKYRKIVGFGRGLAAPQIGKNKSVFVTFIDNVFKTYINPKITNRSESYNLYRECCLSCGYLSVDVKRPESITINYLNEEGENKTEQADEFLARLLQHEYDHLEGIVNIDKGEISSIELMLKNPLEEKLRPLE